MTIVQIEGGLGSQMFGYAAARRLALRHGVPVYLDKRLYRTYPKRRPELHHFNVEAILLSDEQADQICGPNDENVTVVRNKHLHVDDDVLNLQTPHVLLKGNFVSEDYFFDICEVIRRDFTRVSAPSPHFESVVTEISRRRRQGHTPVAVHVRRGDYIAEAETNRFHGVCTPQYYERAARLVNRLVRSPWLFLFSDDPNYAASLLPTSRKTVVATPPTEAPVEDMMLMAECDEHIIANSGYSWWSAWLADRDDHVVIAPRPFIADRRFNTEDMVKRHWIGLGTQPDRIAVDLPLPSPVSQMTFPPAPSNAPTTPGLSARGVVPPIGTPFDVTADVPLPASGFARSS